MSKDNDSILTGARNLEAEALTTIFDKNVKGMYGYAFNLCHDKVVADNIVGDAFSKVLNRFAAGDGPREYAKVRPYLFQAVHNVFIDELRRVRRVAPLEVAIDLPGRDKSTLPERRLEEKIMMESIVTAMDKELTDDQRSVILLRFVEDFSLEETAQIIGKKMNNVKVIQKRGLAKLRSVLEPSMGDSGMDESPDFRTSGFQSAV